MDPSNSGKKPSKEDLEIVRRAILLSQSRPLDQQIVNAVEKSKGETDPAQEIGKKFAKQFENGYRLLIEEIKKNAVEGLYSGNDTTIKPIPVADFEISRVNLKALSKTIAEGKIPDSAIDISADVQFLFYEIGIHFYDQALYEQSIDIFIFLTTINPSVQSFWISLALSYEKNLNFQEAIECLEVAIHCEPADFNPYYGLLRCSEAIKDYSKLEELLEEAKGNEAVKEQAEDLIEHLKSQQ